MRAAALRRTLVIVVLLVLALAVARWFAFWRSAHPATPRSSSAAPVIQDIFPSGDETGVPAAAHPAVTFYDYVDPDSVTASSLVLRDANGNAVAATAQYQPATRQAILTPNASLKPSSEYEVSIMGDPGGVRDSNGKALAKTVKWRFSTGGSPPTPPAEGPGGPILLIVGASNPFSRYYAEILRNEGLNEFNVAELDRVTPQTLSQYDTVILGQLPLSQLQIEMILDWVQKGGQLIAMRPSVQLAHMLGLDSRRSTLGDAYMAINTQSAPGAGLTSEPMQFHGDADLYTMQKGRSVATLLSTASAATGAPAVVVGTLGLGGAAVFTYDLARSVVYTRQGNPAWSATERDGISPIRSDDLFYGPAATDPKPDWVDFTRITIPQADEQQRLLANLILFMNAKHEPLPRIWYFPRGLKAVVVMTGDDHGHGGTSGRFRDFVADSRPGCSVENWECIRGTSNIYAGTVDPHEAIRWQALGFEIGLHVFTGCNNWPMKKVTGTDGKPQIKIVRSAAEGLYSHQLAKFARTYPELQPPSTNRIDCVTWGDYETQPEVELDHGIRLDENYYYWPPKWVQNRPGLFTGSGMPMRFARMDGSLTDVYQAATQITDESHMTIPSAIETLLTNALGPKEYFGAFTVNMHTDHPHSAGADAIVASAKMHHVPVVTALQMLHWLDGRNASSFRDMTWTGHSLEFTMVVGSGGNGVQVMLPTSGEFGKLADLTQEGLPVTYEKQVRMGMEYACFEVRPGKYSANYKH